MKKMGAVCLQSLLKLLNSLLGVMGMGMILYSLWMLRIWYEETGGFWSNPTPPWFIYSFLVLGAILCMITCCGHIAAETTNGHCLSCYSAFIFFFVVFEGALAADIFLNEHWEEDFPPDATGRLDEFENFVRQNFNICKWIGISVVGIQILAIFISGILKVLGPHHGQDFDSEDDDDDYAPIRLPLLVNQPQPTYVAGVDATNPYVSNKNNSWAVDVNQG